MIDLAALTEAVFQRPKSDGAGASLRAALGAGADSVLMAEDLRVEGLTVAQLPAMPLIALRRGATPQLERVITAPIYTWYCLDYDHVGYGNLETFPLLIWQAYQTPLTVGAVAVGSIEVTAGPQTRDAALKALLQVVTVIIITV